MVSRTISKALVGLLVTVLAGTIAADENPIAPAVKWDLFISPGGNDAWSGRLAEPNADRTDGPYATLERARQAVQEMRVTEPTKSIQVALRAGTYRLDKTLVFSLLDSAGEVGTTTFAAYPGESAILSSGVPLGKWTKLERHSPSVAASAVEHLWVTDVPACLGEVLTLYDGLNRLPRAQGRGFTPPHGWPDDGAGRGPCDVFYFPQGVVERYPDFVGADLLVMPTANYEMNILPIAYVDKAKRLGVTRLLASRPIGPMKFHRETMWIENRLEDLDQPGEWVFDSKNRKIYLWPLGERPSHNIVAPRLTELVRVEGEIDYAAPHDSPTRNLVFRGLTFAHAERLPRQGQDGWDLQHSWEQFDRPSGMLRFRGAEGCRVEACRFVAGGGAGVRMDLHCQRNIVRDCEFAHLGGVGILLAGYGPGTKDVNVDNSVVNNWVHHIGELYWASPAIFVWQSGRNLIANNLVQHTPYTGIVVSGRIAWTRTGTSGSVRTVRWNEIHNQHSKPWTWEEREPYLHGRLNRVERNEISSVMERLGDGNGIYVSGTGRGNVIQQNLIHDIDSDHLVQAIRCDDDQEETIIEKNIIFNVRCMHQGITIKGKNDIINNFIVDLVPSRLTIKPASQLRGYIGLEVNSVAGSKIERNIIYSPDPGYAPVIQNRTYGQGDEPRLRDCDADFNLYYCPQYQDWAVSHLNEERQYGVELHSLTADPMFVDVERGDLRLRKESPAHALGIEPIDLESIGLLPNNPYRADTK